MSHHSRKHTHTHHKTHSHPHTVHITAPTSQAIAHIIDREIVYKHSKSGGHGGQNVNKRETKAEGYLNISRSSKLTKEQKQRLLSHYTHQISKDGTLRLTCHTQRHYHHNLTHLKKHFALLLKEIGHIDHPRFK